MEKNFTDFTDKLLNIGLALSSEKDSDVLLNTILEEAMDISNSDAGTIYILNNNTLEFRIMITKSLGIHKGGKFGEITLPPVPLVKTNACAYSQITGNSINIPDVYDSGDFDFSGPKNYDKISGYRTKSMLVIPMENDYGEYIGVLQLINSKDENGEITAFKESHEKVLKAIASQAAVCLTNMNYAKEIVELLDSFVRVMAMAIDERTPYNANHTRNMAYYAEKFLQWVNEQDDLEKIPSSEIRQFIMAVQLHDLGKLIIPLEVMNKETRLASALDSISNRFVQARMAAKIDVLEGTISDDEFRQRLINYDEWEKTIRDANSAGFLSDDLFSKVLEIKNKKYELNGTVIRFLNDSEFEQLNVRKGTLTDEERKIMESHVSLTSKLLSQMNFSRNYINVPVWASMHHETLDGKGYPNHAKADEIPFFVRILTIIDIFDALTASDRPYKPPMPIDKAYGILRSMAEENKLDGSIVELFIKSNAGKR